MAFLFALAGLVSCASDDGGGRRSPLVFNAETNRLNAYAADAGFSKQTVIHSHADDPQNGIDINGQICFSHDGSHFVAGEDTGQPVRPAGWGYFRLDGKRIGELAATEVGKLVATFQSSSDNDEPYGCGFLSDGRLVTTDVGNQAAGAENGQLIVWFPPFEGPFGTVRYCKLDVAIGTAGGIFVDEEDRVYVASARGSNFGVLRYTGPFPTSDDAAGGCGQTDVGGAPLADQISKQRFIIGSGSLAAPSGVVQSPHGTFYVSSVINGSIIEYDAKGQLIRRVLAPVRGDVAPYATGTPFGLGIDAAGNVYYADLGVVIDLGGDIGPGFELGTVRVIRFIDGEPQTPETIDMMLNFPDGIGIMER